MTAPHEEWTVLPHGRLQRIDDRILIVTGTIKMPIGSFERRMSVVRLNDGTLAFYSPVALDEEQMSQIDAFGRPAWLIVPGRHHRLDVKPFKHRYPAAKVIAAPGARGDVEELVAVDATDVEFPDASLRFSVVPGTGQDEAALVVAAEAGTTLILNDILANVQNATGVDGIIARLFGFAGDKPQIPLPEKLGIIDDRKALAAQFRAWAELPLARIVVSHGEPIVEDPSGVLREVAGTLE
ncbi:MAG: hypothetical protein JOZ72_10545 [Alphaproteobacteria bacterium]|nr:hypothetical protein [Alphaproteobacteria bacterium]